MKIKGKKLSGPNKITIVLPRDDGDLVFVAQGVLNYDEFNKLCPTPEPRMITRPGDTVGTPDFEDPKYKEQIRKFAAERTAWMILKSLEATEGLEFESVNMSDHTTWMGVYQEFRDSGLCDMEMTRIVNAVLEANALNDERVEEARERFLASRQRQNDIQ